MARERNEAKKELLINEALRMAEKKGYLNVSKRELGRVSGVADSVVSYYLGTREDTLTMIIDKAIEQKNYIVIAQAISFNDSRVKNIDEKIRKLAGKAVQNREVGNERATLQRIS